MFPLPRLLIVGRSGIENGRKETDCFLSAIDFNPRFLASEKNQEVDAGDKVVQKYCYLMTACLPSGAPPRVSLHAGSRDWSALGVRSGAVPAPLVLPTQKKLFGRSLLLGINVHKSWEIWIFRKFMKHKITV